MFRPFGFAFSSSSNHYITTILLEVAKWLLQNRSCQLPDGAIAPSVVAMRQKRAEFESVLNAFSPPMKINMERLAQRWDWHVAQTKTKQMGQMVSNCWLQLLCNNNDENYENYVRRKKVSLCYHTKWPNGMGWKMQCMPENEFVRAGKTTMWRMKIARNAPHFINDEVHKIYAERDECRLRVSSFGLCALSSRASCSCTFSCR